MTLRTRLSLTLALLTAAAAVLVALGGHRVVADRLDAEIEESLFVYATRVTTFPNRVRFECGFETDSDENGPRPIRRDRRRPGLGDAPLGIAAQCLNPDGSIARAAQLSIPVDDRAKEIADDGSDDRSARWRTEDIDGTSYRILTIALQPDGALQIARDVSENERVLSSLVTRYATLAIGVTTLAGLAGALIARRATRPIQSLTAAAERVAVSGDLDHGEELLQSSTRRGGARDETGRLTRSFVSMLTALRASKSQRAQLVQDAGHELRTPLTSLRTNVAVLRRHPELPEERRAEIVEDLHNELRELTDLTNELVALASAEVDVEPSQPCDLAALATSAADRWERRAEREIVISTEASPIVGQPRRIMRAIDNLLSNAAKFGPAGKSIELTVKAGTVVVRDHGPGIPPEDLARIFDRFYRATNARTLPGSGLGLAIVHDTMAAHGGSATAENHPDGGASFTLRFPR